MRIRVNHGELNQVREVLFSDSQELLNEVTAIENNIEELKTVWQGEEANIFFIKINNYLNKLKSVPLTYQSISTFINRANILYKQADLNLKKEINSARVNN